MARNLGSIYTPEDFASFLTEWAIQTPNDKVLDLGIGEGVFAFAAINRLIKLGADVNTAQAQIYGTEIDHDTFSRFLSFAQRRNLTFPNLKQQDFFEAEFPPMDAVVGNPPYVRRTHIKDVEKIRDRVRNINPLIKVEDLTRLTDLYVYFLLCALPVLRPGSRLSIIVADSWLNVGYGRVLKDYLKHDFSIKELISFDRRVFDDAQVKPVLLFATKKNLNVGQQVRFTRVKNGLPISTINGIEDYSKLEGVSRVSVSVDNLKPEKPWGIYFKGVDVYQLLESHQLTNPVSEIAETRIGIQTLAKDFFVLAPDQAQKYQIEASYLQPLAQSTKYLDYPVIDQNTNVTHQIFYCSSSTEELQKTKALEHIERGESTEVKVRGKGKTVLGYHNKKRIQDANRPFWYDLRTDIERRGRAVILIPRLVYRAFMVIWNKANFVPGELFIEFLPKEPNPDVEAYLAVLTSTPTEIALRMCAQVYGGGTYNINPGPVKEVPILDVRQLTDEQKTQLVQAYRQYLDDENFNRSCVNQVVYNIFGFDEKTRLKLGEVVDDLVLIATSSKQSST